MLSPGYTPPATSGQKLRVQRISRPSHGVSLGPSTEHTHFNKDDQSSDDPSSGNAETCQASLQFIMR